MGSLPLPVAIVCVAAKITRMLLAWAARQPAVNSQYFPSPPKSSQFYRAAPRRSPYSSTLLAAGGRGKPDDAVDGGFNWDVLGNFEKVWEFLRALPPITATLCVAAKRRKTAAALCVCGRALPGV